MKSLIFILFLTCNLFFSFGQESKIDSLFNNLDKSQSRELRLRNYNTLVKNLFVEKDIRLDSLNQDYFVLAKTLGSKYDQAYSLKVKSLLAKRNIDFQSAKEYGFRALDIFSEINENKETINMYYDLSLIYKREPRGMDSSIYFLKKIIDNSDDGTMLSKAHQILARNYRSLGDYDKAINYNNKALIAASNAGNNKVVVRSAMRLGELYIDIGNKEKAIEILLKHKDSIPKSIRYANSNGAYYAILGNAYFENLEYSKALESYNKSLHFYKLPKNSKNSLSSQAFVMMKMGESLIELDLIALAQTKLDSSKVILKNAGINNAELIGGIDLGQGKIHFQREEYFKSIQFAQKANKFFLEKT